jgi:hypothetical protein
LVLAANHQLYAGERQHNSGGAAEHRQHNTFRQGLPHQTHLRCTHGQAHSGLCAARRPACQQQVRQVRTSNQQHQSAHHHQDAQAAFVSGFHLRNAAAGRNHTHCLGWQGGFQLVKILRILRPKVTQQPRARDRGEPRSHAIGLRTEP